MKHSAANVRELFLHHFSRAALEDVFRAVMASYRTTKEHLESHFPDAERVDLRPHYQRAILDRDLRAVAEKHRDRLQHATQLNSNGGARHLEIYAANVTLTAHYIPAKNGTVRYAAHREKLSDPNQIDIFEEASIPVDSKLYAHLLHGCDGLKAGHRAGARMPDFVYVRFPLPGAVTYAKPLVDLIAEFPTLAGRGRSAPIGEAIPDMAQPAWLHKPAVGSQ
jgi:hypothetical protein